eukprot:675310-Alexandrium_andersonii.AAC.1
MSTEGGEGAGGEAERRRSASPPRGQLEGPRDGALGVRGAPESPCGLEARRARRLCPRGAD